MNGLTTFHGNQSDRFEDIECKLKILPDGGARGKVQEVTKIGRFHLLGSMNALTKFNGNQLNRFEDM